VSILGDVTHSFAGTDIRPYFIFRTKGVNIVGGLAPTQQISLSVHSDIGLTRQIGSRFATSIVDGPVTIAGSIVFTVLGESPLLPLARAYREALSTRSFGQLSNIPSYELPLLNHLPPFDIIIFFNNEYKAGEYKDFTFSQRTISIPQINVPVPENFETKPLASSTISIIRNIRFPDTAYNFSIDDMMTELVTQFVATDFMEPTSFKEYTKRYMQEDYNEKVKEIIGKYDSPSPFYLPSYKGDIQKILNIANQI